MILKLGLSRIQLKSAKNIIRPEEGTLTLTLPENRSRIPMPLAQCHVCLRECETIFDEAAVNF